MGQRKAAEERYRSPNLHSSERSATRGWENSQRRVQSSARESGSRMTKEKTERMTDDASALTFHPKPKLRNNLYSQAMIAKLVLAATVIAGCAAAQKAKDVDLAGVTEQHVMIPMRDGVRLSAYLYTPPGEGPWPVLYEQRYA